jgi:hypothetical protein
MRKRRATLPKTTPIRQRDTHRLIPARYSEQSALAELADNDRQLADILQLDSITDETALAEADLAPGIGIDELVFEIPFCHVINAAFTHPNPLGGRFNGPERGAWYAAFELRTAQAEVAFHKTVQLQEINRFEDEVIFDDYLADFSGEFHDILGSRAYVRHLSRDSYVESQGLAEELLRAGSLGIIYPSVRTTGKGTCLACFRPALVGNVRKGRRFRFVWTGEPHPRIFQV